MARRRPFASRVRDALRSLLAFLFSNIGVIGLVIAYTIAGAFMFQAVEGEKEIERANHMMKERDNLAQYLWQNVAVHYNPPNDTAIKNVIREELLTYQDKIVYAVRRGWDGDRKSRQWSFSSAFLYSLTVITTIGYGHLSPRTDPGKILTIFYALLGMPLFLLYLTNVGELLARWFKCIYALVCLCRGCPGFRMRRVARMRTQLEISDAESIERPEDWQYRPDFNMLRDDHPDLRYRPGRYNLERPFRSQERHYSDREDRIPDFGNRDDYNRSYPYRDRYEIYSSKYRFPESDKYVRRPERYEQYRDPLDRYGQSREPFGKYRHYRDQCEVYPPEFRSRESNRYVKRRERCEQFRHPLDTYGETRESFGKHRHYRDQFEMVELRDQHRYEQYRDPMRIPMDSRYMPYPKTYPRRPEYLRSVSMPTPAHGVPARAPRGVSEPARARSAGSSEFSYVTFDAQTITVPICVCVVIMVGYLVFGSMLFRRWEEWGILDGSYFCFISLSSIGFGDFVPGERVYTERIETPFIICSMYLMLGMALVAMCFNLMQEQVIHYFAGLKRALKRICRCKR